MIGIILDTFSYFAGTCCS